MFTCDGMIWSGRITSCKQDQGVLCLCLVCEGVWCTRQYALIVVFDFLAMLMFKGDGMPMLVIPEADSTNKRPDSQCLGAQNKEVPMYEIITVTINSGYVDTCAYLLRALT